LLKKLEELAQIPRRTALLIFRDKKTAHQSSINLATTPTPINSITTSAQLTAHVPDGLKLDKTVDHSILMDVS